MMTVGDLIARLAALPKPMQDWPVVVEIVTATDIDTLLARQQREPTEIDHVGMTVVIRL